MLIMWQDGKNQAFINVVASGAGLVDADAAFRLWQQGTIAW
ncbi:MAG: hypothetical protein R3E95_20110 [Thiolinea sp.]